MSIAQPDNVPEEGVKGSESKCDECTGNSKKITGNQMSKEVCARFLEHFESLIGIQDWRHLFAP